MERRITGSWLPDGFGLGGEPFVEGDGEGEEFVLVVEGVDHFDVEFCAFEGWVVELLDVVEEVAGEGAVGVDDGALEAEVGVVLGDFLVYGGVVDGDGDEGDLGSLCVAHGEEAAVEVFEGGGGDLVVVGGDELDAGVVEGESGVAVVGDDDADGDEAVRDVGEAEEVAVLLVVAGVDGDGDVLVGVGVEGCVVVCGLCWGGFFVGGEGWSRKGAGGKCDAEDEGLIGLHG